ncbi:MAG: enoyl-CoA hydratase [Shimia sp.]
MPILETQRDGPIARLTLNQPSKLNPLSDEMLGALGGAFDALRDDPDTRVVILRGAGKAFCAGHDLRELQALRQAPDGGVAGLRDLFDRCARLMQSITALPQPVIAQVHGIATAAGCQLVASCDLAIAAEGTRFGVNGVNIGLFCSTPMVALSRNVPRKRAFEMLTTGAFLTAEEAATAGLVNRTVAADALAAETDALARTIAAKLGGAVRLGKAAFYEQLEMPVAEAYAHTGAVMARNMMRDDTAEGVAAFLEKRAPDWSQ